MPRPARGGTLALWRALGGFERRVGSGFVRRQRQIGQLGVLAVHVTDMSLTAELCGERALHFVGGASAVAALSEEVLRSAWLSAPRERVPCICGRSRLRDVLWVRQLAAAACSLRAQGSAAR